MPEDLWDKLERWQKAREVKPRPPRPKPLRESLEVEASTFWNNLSAQDKENVRMVVDNIKRQADAEGITVRLLAVGSTINPANRNSPQGDVDFRVFSPELAPNIDTPNNTAKGFDKFTGFLKRALTPLDGRHHIQPPYFDANHENDFDGTFEYYPTAGLNISFFPAYEGNTDKGLETYLNSQTEHFAVVL